MQTQPLLDGTPIPSFGLGTWLAQPQAVYRAVRHAIELGYRHIDCAWIYGNEAEVGQAIAESIAAGDVVREDLWVTTKLWNDAHQPDQVRPALERSLKLLGLDYVELYLVHWPVAMRPGSTQPTHANDMLSLDQVPLERTWEAMAELPGLGLSRQIGVSNFSASKIERIGSSVGVFPAVNQVELHPYNPQRELLEAMSRHSIVATAYSPLGSGGRPPALRNRHEKPLLDNDTVLRIAQRRGASPAQVLIAWALARNTVVIPKSTNPTRIAQNLAATALKLDSEDMDALKQLDYGARYLGGEFWCMPGSPYRVEDLWA